MKNKILIKNITVDYDINDEKIPALNNVSLSIDENEFVCILGPSGCGKSTLLKSIAGFVKPIEGSITLNGVEIDGPNQTRGVVFQDPNLLPWYTVAHNIGLGPKLNKKSNEEINHIVDKFLTQVELEEYKTEKVFELSGGQKQRVAIARTLANNPEVILMDEPFGALDSFTRNKMQTMIRSLWKKNQATVCFVTHDIEEALLLGTTIYVMKSGFDNIVKKYSLDYTNKLYKEPHLKVQDTVEFIKLREEINQLLED